MKKFYQLLLGVALVTMTACGSKDSFPEVTHIPAFSSSVYCTLIGIDGTPLCEDEINGEPSVVVNGIFSVERIFSVEKNPFFDERTISYYTAEESPKKINDSEYIDGGFCTGNLIPVVEKGHEISFIRKNGEEAFTLNEYSLEPNGETKHIQAVNAYFSDGLCLYKNEDGHYGYINTKGEVVIGEYAYAQPFSEGLAVVGGEIGRDSEQDRHFMVINTKGEKVAELNVAFERNNAPAIYSEGLLFFGGKVFNRKGEIAFRLSDNIEQIFPFSNGYAIYEDEEMDYGLIDKTGEIVIRAGEYDEAYIAKDRVYFKNYDGQTICYDFEGNRIFKSEYSIVPVGKNRCVLKSRKDCYFTNYDGESIDKNSYENIFVPYCIFTSNMFLAYIYNNNEDYIQWVKSDYYDADAAVKSVLGALNKNGVGAIQLGMPVVELKEYYNMGDSSRHAYEYWDNFEGVSGEGNLGTSYRVQFTDHIADFLEYNPNAKVGHIFINIDRDNIHVTDAGERIRQAIVSYLNNIEFVFDGHIDEWREEAWDIYRSNTHNYLIAINMDGSTLCLEANK